MSVKTLLAAFAFFFIGGNTLMAQSPSTSTLYELRTYVSEVGRQADVIKLISESGVPMMAKHKLTLVGAWTNVDPKDERVFTLLSHKDKAAAETAHAAFQNDPEWKGMIQKSMVDGKKPVASLERIFLSTNDYSPSLDIKDVGNRVFELRTYVATKGNLPALNARFKNHTVALFAKHGMTNILYCSVLDGEKLSAAKLLEAVSPSGKSNAAIDADLPAVGNSLVYFITHASPEAAKVNFGKFGADEEWQKAYKASEAAAGGSLTVKDGVKSLFLKPTAFSPIK
jgi:hypothetical protein